MSIFLLSVHVIVCLLIIGFVLLQKPDSDGLSGMSGGGGGLGGMMSGRAKSNFLTKTTALLAAALFVTSLLLAVTSQRASTDSIIEKIENESAAPAVPVAGEDEGSKDPSVKVDPKVPVAEPKAAGESN